MKLKINKIMKIGAAALFVFALFLNVNMSLDDPFVYMSDTAVASGYWDTNNLIYTEPLDNSGEVGGFFGKTLESDPVYENASYSVTTGADVTYTATTNTVAFGSETGITSNSGNIKYIKYRCCFEWNSSCDRANEKDVYTLF